MKELYVAFGESDIQGSVYSDSFDTLLLLGRAALTIGATQAEINSPPSEENFNEGACYDITAEED